MEIGGYFELELNKNEEYHKDAIKLNSGRNCLKYLLIVNNVEKIYIPYYICNTVIEPIEELGIEYSFYHINSLFEIENELVLKDKEKLLYVNYFSLKNNYVKELVEKYGQKLIIDNTQAFYSKRLEQVDTFYSPRKFVGVSDGGYLYSNKILDYKIAKDTSVDNSLHLLGRLDSSASSWYDAYKQAEKNLSNKAIREMSGLTSTVLKSLDYSNHKEKRKRNYLYLHYGLENINNMDLKIIDTTNPVMIYPFYSKRKNLREVLIENGIYVAQYWPEVIEKKNINKIEADYALNLVPLPIDQRYGENEMNYIIQMVRKHA